MKKMICLAALAACLTVFSSVALAQRFALIGKAGFEPGEYNPLFGQKYLKGLKSDGVIPGAEFMLNFGHRWLTVSFEYAHQKFTAVSSHVVQVSDGFSYFGPDGKLVFFSMPGKEIVGFDLTANHEINLIGGNFYLNVVREGRVLPFVGGGVSYGFVKSHYVSKGWAIPEYVARRPDWSPSSNSGDYTSSETRLPIPKFAAGVNIIAVKHLVIRPEGGYRNGVYFAIGAGVTF